MKKLKANRDEWRITDACVRDLEPYAAYIPGNLISDYLSALTVTYVGYMGSSARYSRRDFYADGAALRIPKMFQAFDDKAAEEFVHTLRGDALLNGRARDPAKMRRLRSRKHRAGESIRGVSRRRYP